MPRTKRTPDHPDLPEQVKKLRRDIDRVVAMLNGLREEGFTDRAIIIMIEDQTKVGKRVIQDVLEGLEGIRKNYFKKPPKSLIEVACRNEIFGDTDASKNG